MYGQATTAPEARVPNLIGRDDVLRAAVDSMRDPATRLLTVTGPVGVGKTRFATELAGILAGAYDGGAITIDLTILDNPHTLDAEMARLIGLRVSDEARLPADIDAWLATHAVLIVLHSAEHVLEIGTRLTRWLALSPRSRVLVTSRHRLHLSVETELELTPLDVGDPSAARPAGLSPAAELFARMAGEDQPGRIPAETRAAIERLCARLEGLPLTMELVAAQLPELAPASLDALTAVEGPLANAIPELGGVLDAAVNRSYWLLSPDSRGLLRYLTACWGGFSLELAELVVTHAAMLDIDSGTVADCLDELASHHLVSRIEGARLDTPRFRMLRMVSSSAGRRLDEHHERADAQAAHAMAVIEYAERREYAGLRPRHEYQIGELNENYHNITAALASLLDRGDGVGAMRLVGGLTWYWYAHGHYADGLAHFERVMQLEFPRDGVHWARLQLGYGVLLDLLGRFEEANLALRGALATYDFVGTPEGLASASIALGFNTFHLSDYDNAEVVLEQALLHASRVPDPGLAQSLEAVALSNLGANAHEQGAVANAEVSLRRAAELHDQLGFLWGSARARGDLGGVLRDRGDHDGALAEYRAALDHATQLGDYRLVAVALAGIATVLAHNDRFHLSAWLWGAVEALRPVAGTPSYLKTNSAAWQQAQVIARERLGATKYDAARASGALASQDDLLTLAREVDLHSAARFTAPAEPLTRQERNVLELLDQGLSTRSIATALGISDRTVSSHLGSLFSKYDVGSRLELIAVAAGRRER